MPGPWASGCLILLLIGPVGFILILLSSIAIPSFNRINEKARSAEAMNTIATIAKECAVKKANREIKPTFDVPILDNYTFKPENGNCDGNKNNSFTAVSEDLSKYPTFSYNVLTGAKTCSHDGPKEELHGCSARRNGEW